MLGTCSPQSTVLERLLDSGKLRVVTRNSPTAYYIGPEGAVGPEYDLAKNFADWLGVELEVYTPDSIGEILGEVEAGRADVAAASLTVTPERAERVLFGPEYQRVTQQLIYRLNTGRPRSLYEVVGGRLEVVADSSHAENLLRLRRLYPALTWLEDPNQDVQDLLESVSAGELDYTVADSTAYSVSKYFHPHIRVAFDISEPQPLAWAFKAGMDDSLVQAAREYFSEMEISGALPAILERYYGHIEQFDYVGTRKLIEHSETRLPDYRHWFEQAGEETGIDWRLLAAIGYQESHWNPKAVSPTGVQGMMMLTRATARQLKIPDRTDPKASILGGARYFARVKGRVPERIREPDRTLMALAAYNVGFGHLEDARIITETRGKNPDRWLDVRDSLPLLAQRKWYAHLRYGYARGWEPVQYVDNIRSYYETLRWVTADSAVMTADAASPATDETEKTP
jgi:membrane-bound lytic murein transglycosylase F